MKSYIVVRLIGRVLFGLALAAIILGLLTVLATKGMGAFLEMMSPFNFANILMMALAVSPGYLLLRWADSLEAKYLAK